MYCNIKWLNRSLIYYGGAMSSMNTNERIVPLLPLRGVLVYPTMVLHLDVGRDKSIQALEQAAMDENIIF